VSTQNTCFERVKRVPLFAMKGKGTGRSQLRARKNSKPVEAGSNTVPTMAMPQKQRVDGRVDS